MDEIDNGDTSYSALKYDSEYLLSFIDKYVTVHLIKDLTLLGFVHSIDPVTSSVILQVSKEDSLKPMIIPGHAVLDITPTPIPEGIILPSQKSLTNTEPLTYTEDSEEMIFKKNKLMSWFKKNLLPVTEDGKDIVVGSASVLPPYGSMDIYAESSVVATKIRKIIDDMPADFNSF